MIELLNDNNLVPSTVTGELPIYAFADRFLFSRFSGKKSRDFLYFLIPFYLSTCNYIPTFPDLLQFLDSLNNKIPPQQPTFFYKYKCF